jgi:S-adenosyl-L-methionine hydrolase (adenosine-forming)
MTGTTPAIPVVTFTTDFGTADGYVGAMKGVVLGLCPQVVLVDVTHEIPPFDVAAGAFALAQAAPHYPPGSIHVAVVDPGVGGERADLIVEAGGALFIGPDNGVLSLAARGPRVAHQITSSAFRREPVCPTFHGRDVFAAAAGRLAVGVAPREAGPLLPAIEELAGVGMRATDSEGVVVHVDRFGNLVTSLIAEALAPGRWSLSEVGGGDRRRLSVDCARTFADVERGALVAYAGSAGLIEIAVREGSAAATTGYRRGTRLSFARPS